MKQRLKEHIKRFLILQRKIFLKEEKTRGEEVICMTRDEMINILVEDKLTDWIYARNTEGLTWVLEMGWKGFEDYTNKELKEMIEHMFDEEQVRDLLESSAKRLEEEQNPNRKVFPWD